MSRPADSTATTGAASADTSALPPPLSITPGGRTAESLLEVEWLLTNGLGGFAEGTVTGARTRRYHSVLTAARRPPADRWVTLAQVAVRVWRDQQCLEPSAFEFPGAFQPRGWPALQEFRRESAVMRRRWKFDAVELLEELALLPGRNVAAQRWTLAAGEKPVWLELIPLVANRPFHHLRRRDRSGRTIVERPAPESPAVSVRFEEHEAPTLHLSLPGGRFDPAEDWWFNFLLREERNRGVDHLEDLFTPGRLGGELGPARRSLTLWASVDDPIGGVPDFDRLVAESRARRAAVVAGFQAGDVFEQRLAEATLDFIVRRGAPDAPADPALHAAPAAPVPATPPPAAVTTPSGKNPVAGKGASGKGVEARSGARAPVPPPAVAPVLPTSPAGPSHGLSIIAGYPWFGDWGRDTFIALPGLLLAGRRLDEAKAVFRTFADAMKDGLIPNRFTDDGKGADYNSVDASLWFIRALGEYHRAGGDRGFIGEVGLPACEAVLDAYRKGTRYGIRETADGLIHAGEAGEALTWMDARRDGTVFTQRAGCPIEVAALWHHALGVTASLRRAVGRSEDDLLPRAARTRLAINEKYWDNLHGRLADVVHEDGARDITLRPNQIFAVSLDPSPLTVSRQQQVVDTVEQQLLTPFGLRTLPPGHGQYHGRYLGKSLWELDAAYHQGTAWVWLLGPFLEGMLRAGDFARTAVRKAESLIAAVEPHLARGSVGQLSELVDAEAPHPPRGASAQAWSVAEILRVKQLIRRRKRPF